MANSYEEGRRYFSGNPLFLQMHQQEVRLRATIEAIKESHIRQFAEMGRAREFVEKFYEDEKLQRSISEISDWPDIYFQSNPSDQYYKTERYQEHIRGRENNKKQILKFLSMKISLLRSYLVALSVDIGNTGNTSEIETLFHLRGAFDAWYVKKIESLKEGFDDAIAKIFESTKQ